jgi:pimeloyl-ACP methyl ester carboxylesterase
MRALFEYDFAPALEELSVPISGLFSGLGEPVNEARIRKVLPKFRATTLPGAGHFLMMEDPAGFNAALETEIQALLAAGS